MSNTVIILHSVITCLSGIFAVIGIFFPFIVKKKNKAIAESSEETEKTAKAKNDGIDKNEAVNKSEDIKEISFTATVIYSIFVFLLVVAAGMWIMFFFNNSDVLFLAKRVLLISVLFVAAYYDHAAYRIPNKLILYGVIVRIVILIFELIFARDTLSQVLISEGVAFIAMLVLSVVSLIITRNGLGMGDIKLFLLMSLLQGVAGIISALFASLLVSFVYSVILLVLKKKSRKDFIAFAPCILIGTYFSVMMLGA